MASETRREAGQTRIEAAWRPKRQPHSARFAWFSLAPPRLQFVAPASSRVGPAILSPASVLVRQRIWPHLELHELGGRPFAGFHVERRARRDWGVNGLALPAAIRIIDAAVQ